MPVSDANEGGPADIEKSAVEWLRAELEDPEITASDNFLDVGGHSVTFSKLNKFLSDRYGLALDMRVTYDEPLSKAISDMRPVPGSVRPMEKGV